MEDSFRCTTILPEDEEIAKKQIAEDMSLYGSRPDPPDAVEVDEHTQLSNLPPKRSAAEFDAAVNRPAKVRRKNESKEFNFQRVTAIDWNSGATPLDAWLNQSAVPSIVPLPQTQWNQSSSSRDDLAAKELEDLKVFRTIHIEGIEEPKSVGIPRNSAIDLTTLEPSTQIYLRNILDRYPLLPSYLALRLAKANCIRANRLEITRHNRRDQLTSKPVQVNGHDCRPSSVGSEFFDCPDAERFFNKMGLYKPKDHIRELMEDQKAQEKRIRERLKQQCQGLRSHTEADPLTGEQGRDVLHRHQQRLHMTSLPSISLFRYHVILNAPTAMIGQADEIPVTYLDKGQAYVITIHDRLQSIGLSRYRTVIHVSFEDEQQRQKLLAYWQRWEESRGLHETYQRSGKLQAVEYLGLNPAGYMEIEKPCIVLETASFDSFSVTWSPAPYIPTVSCSILVRFNCLSSDLGYFKGSKAVPACLYAKTETLSSNTSNPLLGPEICFCKMRLFGKCAVHMLSLEFRRITKTIDRLEQQIALMENNNRDIGSASNDVQLSMFMSSQGSNGRSAAEGDPHTRLAKMRLMLSSIRPTSVLNVGGGERDDPDDFSVIFPGGSRFRQQPASRKFCTICSKSDHQLEDCPYQKREFSSSRANTGFWAVGGSRSRASSVHSQSSERNSSLHGSGRLDLEDQDLSFPGDRSRRPSASFSESSAAFPPPPVYIERERYPPADGGKEIMDQAPKPLRFFCDICEQEIEVLRRRDWQ